MCEVYLNKNSIKLLKLEADFNAIADLGVDYFKAYLANSVIVQENLVV